MEIVHSDVNAQNITNGYYVLGLQHLDGGTSKQPGLAFTRSGGQKIGAIEPYVNSSYNNCYMDFYVLDRSTNNLTMRLKANGNSELYNDLDMNGNDVEQVESVYFNSDNAGRIYYNGSLGTMGFYTNNALALTIESNGVLVSTSNHDMNNAYRVINCLDPTADQDVATKAYVDKTPKLICRFHGINVSSSWKTFVCDMNDARNNANYALQAPDKQDCVSV